MVRAIVGRLSLFDDMYQADFKDVSVKYNFLRGFDHPLNSQISKMLDKDGPHSLI